ncbi:MAG: twin-arginine translocation signal domain-containing protein [Candidatus Zixiibacteriota bacterium]
MGESKLTITRRDFIKGAGATAVGMAIGLPALAQEVVKEPAKSRVVLVRYKDAVGGDGKINGAIIQQMLDDAVTALFDNDDPVACWKRIIKPDDIVGIKSNVWAYLPTPPEVEQAIKKRVMDAGVPEKNIGIDDRGVLYHPIFKKATALINTRPMRTHAWSGVGSLIKNYIMFDPNPQDYHPDSCATLGSLWNLPVVKGKTRLNVLVMLTPLFHGVGWHHFNPKYVWPYRGLIVGADPVAVDAIGLQILRARRREYFGKDSPINPPPHHIMLADKKYHLGTSDLKRIELVRLGWEEGVLI